MMRDKESRSPPVKFLLPPPPSKEPSSAACIQITFTRPTRSIVKQQSPRVDLQSARDTRNVVNRHVAFRPLDRTEIGPIDPAFVRQRFLTETACGTKPAHVARQHVPQLALVRPFHGR